MEEQPVRTEPRTLEQQVRIYRRQCAHCGKEFEGTGKQRYCRPACRVMEFDARNVEKRRERQRRYQRRKHGEE